MLPRSNKAPRLIIIVEDRADNLALLKAWFAESDELDDYTIRAFTGGSTFINWIQGWATLARTVCLVILDIQLPGKDGFEVFSELRTHNYLSDTVPIVACTALDTQEARMRARDQGFAGFLAKPLNMETLEGDMAKLLRGESVGFEKLPKPHKLAS